MIAVRASWPEAIIAARPISATSASETGGSAGFGSAAAARATGRRRVPIATTTRPTTAVATSATAAPPTNTMARPLSSGVPENGCGVGGGVSTGAVGVGRAAGGCGRTCVSGPPVSRYTSHARAANSAITARPTSIIRPNRRNCHGCRSVSRSASGMASGKRCWLVITLTSRITTDTSDSTGISATATAEGGDTACGPPVPGTNPRSARTAIASNATDPIARGIADPTTPTGISQNLGTAQTPHIVTCRMVRQDGNEKPGVTEFCSSHTREVESRKNCETPQFFRSAIYLRHKGLPRSRPLMPRPARRPATRAAGWRSEPGPARARRRGRARAAPRRGR